MATLELGQLVEATGGRLMRGDPGRRVDFFTIDARLMKPGGVFFALKGSRTDGHAYLAQALAGGAAAAVVEREPRAADPAPEALIRVDDVAGALARAGRHLRRTRRDVQWIGLTGSNGKTTTKEMIAAGLSATRRTHRTPGNYNNRLGVPLTLLALPDDAEVAVIEMGMSAPGEIAELTEIVDPDIGLVTNIHAVHTAFFRSLDDLAAAKGELFALLRDDAVAVVNADEMHVRVQASRHVGPQVTFGRAADVDVRLEAVEGRYTPGTALVVRHGEATHRLQLRIGGTHAAFNALAALATLAAAGVELGPAAERIERLEPGPGRGKLHRLDRGIVVVDDSYNSSPPALAAVLETLRQSEPAGRRVLVLGDMLELGAMEEALHREAGRRAGTAGVQLFVAVGKLARFAAEAARRNAVADVHHFPTATKAAEALPGMLAPGDLVVIKGSRAVRLERVVQAVTTAFEEVG